MKARAVHLADVLQAAESFPADAPQVQLPPELDDEPTLSRIAAIELIVRPPRSVPVDPVFEALEPEDDWSEDDTDPGALRPVREVLVADDAEEPPFDPDEDAAPAPWTPPWADAATQPPWAARGERTDPPSTPEHEPVDEVEPIAEGVTSVLASGVADEVDSPPPTTASPEPTERPHAGAGWDDAPAEAPFIWGEDSGSWSQTVFLVPDDDPLDEPPGPRPDHGPFGPSPDPDRGPAGPDVAPRVATTPADDDADDPEDTQRVRAHQRRRGLGLRKGR